MNLLKRVSAIEALLLATFVVVALAAAFIALDPSFRYAQARDTQRRDDLITILNAMLSYRYEHGGNLPEALDREVSTAQVIGTASEGCSTTCTALETETSCLDLSAILVPEYLRVIPEDPVSGVAENTDYYVNMTAGGLLQVGACDSELLHISVSR